MPDPGETLRRLRHELRGAYHHLLLCLDALEVEGDPSQSLEWLDHIDRAAGRCEVALDELDGVVEEQREPAGAGD